MNNRNFYVSVETNQDGAYFCIELCRRGLRVDVRKAARHQRSFLGRTLVIAKWNDDL